MESFAEHGKRCGFYPMCNGSPLESLKQDNDMIKYTFLKAAV